MKKLSQCLRADGYCLIRRRSIWLMPLCFAALIIMDSIDIAIELDMIPDISTWYFYFQSLSFGGLYGPYLGPMLCALPYAGALAAERRTGLVRSSVPRAERTPYLLSKYLWAVLSGALVYALGIVCLVIFCRLMGLPYIHPSDIEGMQGFCYFDLFDYAPWRYYLVAVWYAFLSGGLYAGIAALVATRTTQSGVVAVTPLVTTFLVIRLCQLIGVPMEYRLDRWLVMRMMPPNLNDIQSLLLITAICLGLSVLIGAGCVLSGRRSMRDA